MKKNTTFVVALLAVIGAVVIAGCGGGGSSSSSSAPSGMGAESKAVSASEPSGGGTIAGGEVEGLGKVLVDSEGMTVYEFTEDKGSTSVCYGECETAWPPVLAKGKPSAGSGAMSSALGTTKRKDGTMQVTYEGHPLYTFVGDKAPGEATGQGDEGVWFVLNESGSAVEGTASVAAVSKPEESESEGSSGGTGYGY